MQEKEQRLIQKLTVELGQKITEALYDKEVVEIMLNPDGQLWIEKRGEMIPAGTMSAVNALALMGTIASALGVVVNRDHPVLEGELPLDGSRFQGLVPPIVQAPTFAIRKKAGIIFSLEDYQTSHALNECQAQFLADSVKNHKNILIAGGTGSGKTTFTNALILKMVELCPDERLVIIEDTSEIQCSATNTVMLRSSLNVDMLMLLKSTLRLRPDRILVGEVRGKEALALLKAWNTGHAGGIATVHANDSLAALYRVEQLVMESGISDVNVIKQLVANAIDVVVFIIKTSRGRKITEILQVEKTLNEKGDYAFSYFK